jgi:hypothetical protein
MRAIVYSQGKFTVSRSETAAVPMSHRQVLETLSGLLMGLFVAVLASRVSTIIGDGISSVDAPASELASLATGTIPNVNELSNPVRVLVDGARGEAIVPTTLTRPVPIVKEAASHA